jgi:hypothetical protein
MRAEVWILTSLHEQEWWRSMCTNSLSQRMSGMFFVASHFPYRGDVSLVSAFLGIAIGFRVTFRDLMKSKSDAQWMSRLRS